MKNKWIKRGIFLCCLMPIFMNLPRAEASEEFQQESEKWSHTANQIVRLVEKKDLLGARSQLSILARQFSKSDLSDKNLSVEGIHVLSDVIIDMERNLNQVIPDEGKMVYSATRLQIAFDAVSHSHQPLWQQYYSPLKQDVGQIQEEIRHNNRSSVQKAIDQMYDDYQMVRPALIVSKSPHTVQKVDSLVTFIRKQEDLKKLQSSVKQLEALLQPLFFGSEKDVTAVSGPLEEVSLYTITLWVSGLIVMVLSYVSWRKYRAMRGVV
ncbi:sporulation protein YpjB [Paenactinomyces guangxiensis]|uniref:Sporulation protein YpjB n=1 Tax=Paenactinomyces guangxiensis TaxID=1490290 RepID=A0A7W1WU19_9BACL|nr:sporulation protein YpjB [Paenactinomyces guangxiensis]MBA4496065.1 hypothetical protein [Paenactinomyces guangxiensis]MBH8593153.1 hypothetical protein [Paenactinomyces guangxiensis]